MKHLLFQIAAPMMSWGNEMARSERPTDGHPRKSAILGLLGAALGKPRSDPWHNEAHAALGFATAVLRPGVRIMDYHTVSTPEGTKRYETRHDEVEASDYTVQTTREYLCDAYFMVALWPKKELDLKKISESLERPVWELYAGRKSCPFSLPLAPKIFDVPTLQEAFQAYQKTLWKPLLTEDDSFKVYWEDHPSAGVEADAVSVRNDSIVSLPKRLFRSRTENEGSLVL